MWFCQQCGLENTEGRVTCKDCDGIRVAEADDLMIDRNLEELFLEGTGI